MLSLTKHRLSGGLVSVLSSAGGLLRLHRTVRTAPIKTAKEPKENLSSVVHALLERILRDREHERRLWADLMANRVSAGSDNDDDSDSARLELEDKYWREERRASVFERDLIHAKAEVKCLKSDLNPWTALDILDPILRSRVKIGAKGVQSVIDAVVAGNLDDSDPIYGNESTRTVTYLDARDDILAKLSPSGEFETQLINQASATLYAQLRLKTHMYDRNVDPIVVQEGDYTEAETIAIMSIFLFVHRLTHCLRPDMRYTNSAGRQQFSISSLVHSRLAARLTTNPCGL
ncbi:hypothetical protein C8J57DRAFT_733092 [Mycena rebaudengoi]|nr:hypothetical protein C8J57DRAFT_733092 [Mycena rebaudengoi]